MCTHITCTICNRLNFRELCIDWSCMGIFGIYIKWILIERRINEWHIVFMCLYKMVTKWLCYYGNAWVEYIVSQQTQKDLCFPKK